MEVELFFITTEGRAGLVSAFIGRTSSVLVCVPIDGEAVSESISNADMASKNYTILDVCRTQLTPTYQATTERSIRNKSPYRGFIDE